MIARGAKGLFFEVPTDDPKQVADSAILQREQDAPALLRALRRPAGRRTRSTTSRSAPATLPSRGCSTTRYTRPTPLRGRRAPRGDPADPDPSLQLRHRRPVRRSALPARSATAPVPIRSPLYLHTVDPPPKLPKRLHPLKVFCSARHSLHHVRERGYVERPARVDVILKAIERSARRRAPARPQLRRGADPRRARRRFRQLSQEHLHRTAPGELLYPYVFPIRRTDRPPYDRSRPRGLLLHRHVHAIEPRRLQGRPGRGERRALGRLGDPRRRAARLLACAALPATTPSATPTAASATSATARSPRSTSRRSSAARSRCSTSTTTTATARRTSSTTAT